jgi:hypothetical protein
MLASLHFTKGDKDSLGSFQHRIPNSFDNQLVGGNRDELHSEDCQRSLSYLPQSNLSLLIRNRQHTMRP